MLNFVRSQPPASPPPGPTSRALGLFALWYGRWSSRRQLACMDDRMLRDIGLAPRERSREVRKPVWRS